MENKEVVRLRFGSHLYGTATEKSDLDFKGVFLPSKREILLGKIPKSLTSNTGNDRSKNSPEDIDEEIYSLHYFIELACKGETVALDMLHAPLDFVEHYTSVWKFIVDNRQRFYTKNLKAFVGYARRQAAKYGIKGSRLNAAKQLLDFLIYEFPDERLLVANRLFSVWEKLPLGEHQKMIESSPNGIRQYEICGRILQETITGAYAYNQIKIFYDAYGARAKLAAKNEGIDWKAISHALRAAYQVKEVLTDKTITFPRPEAKFLLEVKQGQLDYLSEVAPHLEELIAEVEILAAKSDLPEKADKGFWDDFIIETMEKELSFR